MTAFETYIKPEHGLYSNFPEFGKMHLSKEGKNNQYTTDFCKIYIDDTVEYYSQVVGFYTAIVIDVDRQSIKYILNCLDKDDRLMPNEIIRNKHRDGVHMVYLLNTPVSKFIKGELNEKQFSFYRDVNEKLKYALHTLSINVDFSFNYNNLVKNPLHENHVSHILSNKKFELRELSDFTSEYGYSKKKVKEIRETKTHSQNSSQHFWESLLTFSNEKFIPTIGMAEAKFERQFLNGRSRDILKDNASYRSDLIKYLSAKFTKQDIASELADAFNVDLNKASKERSVIVSHAGFVYEHVVLDYNQSYRNKFCQIQATRSSLALFHDYAKDNKGNSKNLLNKTIENVATQLHSSTTQQCKDNNISEKTLHKYRKSLSLNGAAFINYKAFNKLDDLSKEKMIQNNKQAYANYIGNLFIKHFFNMRKMFKVNWFNFISLMKSLMKDMNHTTTMQIEMLITNFKEEDKKNISQHWIKSIQYKSIKTLDTINQSNISAFLKCYDLTPANDDDFELNLLKSLMI